MPQEDQDCLHRGHSALPLWRDSEQDRAWVAAAGKMRKASDWSMVEGLLTAMATLWDINIIPATPWKWYPAEDPDVDWPYTSYGSKPREEGSPNEEEALRRRRPREKKVQRRKKPREGPNMSNDASGDRSDTSKN